MPSSLHNAVDTSSVGRGMKSSNEKPSEPLTIYRSVRTRQTEAAARMREMRRERE